MDEKDFVKSMNEAIEMYENGEILETADLLQEIANSIKEYEVD